MNMTLNRNLKLLIAFNSLRSVSDIFLGTFFVSFIMHTSINDILSVSLYQFFNYSALMIGFLLIANFVKRYNKVVVFVLNQIPKIIFLLMIIFYQEKIVEYIIPMGMLFGLNTALYWLPLHTMVSENLDTGLTRRYEGMNNAFCGAVNVSVPILLGFFISSGSYEQMAKVLLFLGVVEVIMAFFLKRLPNKSGKSLDLQGFCCCMTRFPVIRKLFMIEVLRGFSVAGVLGTVITMYTVHIFKTDLNLGIFGTIFAVFSIITSLLFSKYATKKMFPKILFAACMAALFSLGMFVWYTNNITLLIYNFVCSTGISLLSQIADVNMYNLSNSKCVTRDSKTEYFVFRESALAIGRLVAFVALLYLAVFGGYEYLRYYLIFITVAILLMGYLSIKINKSIRE